jgi:acyl-CoA synthetase (AMP-forming)/AMP-acid ligase II
VRELLLRSRLAEPARAAVIAEGAAVSWADLVELAIAHERKLRDLRRARVGVRLAASAGCYAGLAALDALDAAVVVMDAGLGLGECRQMGRDLGLAAVVSPAGFGGRELSVDEVQTGGSAADRGSVTLLTSGTTGKPKAARHSWASLARPVRRGDPAAGRRWLLTYRPNLYAGLQVALQCLANQGTLVVPRAGASPPEIACVMAEQKVECASGTASYWRRLLLFADREVLRQVPLRQVTLGGEVVDQEVLRGVAAAFPAARIVHVYATTELGRCFSVSDGRAGFPAAFLGAVSPDGVELRVVDGELHVRSANAMEAYEDRPGVASPARPWARADLMPTGDLVEVRGDRVFFVGRRSDVINVGGNKVHPAEVERVLRAVPGLGDVRVYARPSSIAGQLVACDVVPEAGVDPVQLRRALVRRCADGLLPFQRPRVIQVVDEIAVSASGKVLRRAPP